MLVLGCHGNACGGQRTAWFAFLLLYGLLQESWLVSSRAVLLSLPPISRGSAAITDANRYIWLFIRIPGNKLGSSSLRTSHLTC